MNLCFLPGALCDGRVFSAQITAATNAGHYCTVLDLRTETTIETMAARVVEMTPPGVVLVGLSLGGIVAAQAVAHAPEHVGAIALLDTNLAAPDEHQIAVRRHWASQVRAGEFARVAADNLTDALTMFPSRNRELIFEMAMATTAAGFMNQNTALLKRHDRRDTLRGFDRPVLIAVGAEDHICPPAIHAELASRCSEPTVHVIADAGHLSTIDQPDALNEMLVDWLKFCTTKFNTLEGPNEYHYA